MILLAVNETYDDVRDTLPLLHTSLRSTQCPNYISLLNFLFFPLASQVQPLQRYKLDAGLPTHSHIIPTVQKHNTCNGHYLKCSSFVLYVNVDRLAYSIPLSTKYDVLITMGYCSIFSVACYYRYYCSRTEKITLQTRRSMSITIIRTQISINDPIERV